MDKLIVDGLTRFDSSRIDKILENAVLAGNSDLIEKLLGFSNLVLNTAQKEALSKLDFLPTILLYGPPNTGKTTSTYSLFKKIKLEISNSANLYVLSVASITSSEYGVTSKNIVAAFDELKKISTNKEPSILIIDEIDQLCISRSHQNEHDASRRAMSTLMLELDKLHPSVSDGLIVIGITNIPEKIDSAVIRRFNLKIKVNHKLDLIDFQKYLNSLLILFGNDKIETVRSTRLFETYRNSNLTIPDIKGSFRNALIEKKSCDFDLISFIENEISNGYSSIENKLN